MRAMARRALVLVAIANVALVVTSCFASPAFDQLHQWDPSESWQGGKQYDPRLEKPVRFWQAAVALAEVFQGVEQQTGVKLSFSPEGDENRRVRVHLFLNEKQPPTLRELMAQLQWVVDCPFFLTEEEGQKRYFLMSTSAGQGAEQAMLARREAGKQQREQLWVAMDQKLEEYRQALQLSREELIRTYRGKDDFLLLTLLDPKRRAAAQIVCRHLTETRPPEQFATSDVDFAAYGRSVQANEFAPEDVADLRSLCDTPPNWVNMGVSRSYNTHAEVALQLLPIPKARGLDGMPVTLTIVILSQPSPALLSPEQEVELRQALGERMTAKQEAEFVKQRNAEINASKQGPGRALSAKAEERLTSLLVPLAPLWYYPRWQLFEQLARASGYHVVSDAFVADGEPAPQRSHPPRPVMPDLDALTVSSPVPYLRSPQWEWGDAGTFLRFRSANRDVYRAALLPAEFLDWMDGLIRPFLPPDPKAKTVQFTLPVDLPEWSRRFGNLTTMQLQFSSGVRHTAPDDLAGRARDEVLSSFLNLVQPGLLQFLATLTDAQWQRLKEGGLNWPGELAPDQARLLAAQLNRSPDPYGPSEYSRMSFTIAETEEGRAANDQSKTEYGDPFWFFTTTGWRIEKDHQGHESAGQDAWPTQFEERLAKQVSVRIGPAE